LYYYDRTGFEYNTYFPIAYIAFSSFNGVTFGVGIDFTRHNFTKQDFSSKHSFRVDISTLGNFSVGYTGRFRHLINRWDAVVDLTYARPEHYNFFFGIGNHTVKSDELFDDRFYQINYNSVRANLGLRRDFWKKSYAGLHLGYEHNHTVDEANNILSQGDFFGTGTINLYKFLAEMEFDLRDHPVFPTQGFRFRGQQEFGIISEKVYGISDVFMEFFASTRRKPLTLGLRGGYSNSFNDVPFYKLPSLGQHDGLRGFQKHRFVGKGRLYLDSEVRVFLAEVLTSVFPFEIGLRGFYDTGKIVQPDENTGEWHQTYGGGFYVIPFTRSYTLSLLLGFSEEETALIGLNFGTNF
jgi:outer membrane protein assembly factor BamA